MGGPTLTRTITEAHTRTGAEPLRVGIIGVGVISGQYLASIARLPELTLVAVADLDAERAAAVAAEQGVRALTVDELLAADDIDVVLNLTIPAAHFDVSMAVLAAGKSVYVEKPLALTVEDGRELIRVADAAGLRIGAAPDTVLGTGVQTARALIDDGRIGIPIGATASWSSPGHERWHPAPDFYYREGGGPLFDMGPYYLSSLVTLLGPVTRVSATSGRSARERSIGSGPRAGEPLSVETDTHVTALLEHAGGAVSTVLLSFEVWGSHQPHIEVFGTNGSISVPDPNRFDGTVELLGASREWHPVEPAAGYIDAGRGYGLADLATAVSIGAPHRAAADVALHVVDIMESIQRAARERSAVDLRTSMSRLPLVPLLDLTATAAAGDHAGEVR